MTSVLNVDTIADKAGTGPVALTKQQAAKMFANIGGDGTPTVTGSFNVTSLTDEGTGVIRANMSNAMSDTTYTNIGTIREQSFIGTIQELSSGSSDIRTSSSMVMKTHTTSTTADADGRHYVVFGDLA
tara:strand:- start:233 stop:616 length:384 start_codon:yes stop_codon:yes gene_type:complete